MKDPQQYVVGWWLLVATALLATLALRRYVVRMPRLATARSPPPLTACGVPLSIMLLGSLLFVLWAGVLIGAFPLASCGTGPSSP